MNVPRVRRLPYRPFPRRWSDRIKIEIGVAKTDPAALKQSVIDAITKAKDQGLLP